MDAHDLKREHQCPLLGECLKRRIPTCDQIKLIEMLEEWEKKHWSWVVVIKIGRLVKRLRKKKGITNGQPI